MLRKRLCYVFVIVLFGCNQNGEQPKEKKQEQSPVKIKPGAMGTDSLQIISPAVVFFEPDSIQLEKIKAITGEREFTSMAHEAEFQIYTVSMYVKKNRPELQTLHAKNVRYIVFVKMDGNREIVDLDKIPEAWGMYVFDPKKDPRPADMMSVDTEIPNYFSK
jgi:hypothetical protein